MTLSLADSLLGRIAQLPTLTGSELNMLERIQLLEAIAKKIPEITNCFTKTSATFSLPASGATKSISVDNTVWMEVGMYLRITDKDTGKVGIFKITAVTDTTTIVGRLAYDDENASEGTSIGSGASVVISGAAVTGITDITPIDNLWFVSESTGDDTTGTGSIAKPFATWHKAESEAAVGDTIVVFPGTYTLTDELGALTKSLHWHFYPGTFVVTDDDVPTEERSIWDDEGNSMSLVVTGYLTPQCARGAILRLTNSNSKAFVEVKRIPNCGTAGNYGLDADDFDQVVYKIHEDMEDSSDTGWKIGGLFGTGTGNQRFELFAYRNDRNITITGGESHLRVIKMGGTVTVNYTCNIYVYDSEFYVNGYNPVNAYGSFEGRAIFSSCIFKLSSNKPLMFLDWQTIPTSTFVFNNCLVEAENSLTEGIHINTPFLGKLILSNTHFKTSGSYCIAAQTAKDVIVLGTCCANEAPNANVTIKVGTLTVDPLVDF